MYNKFVIFAVFALLVRQCLTSTPYGLSTDQSKTFEQLVVGGEEALQIKYQVGNRIFDLLDQFATGLIWSNCKPDGTIDFATTGKAVVRDWRKSVDYATELFLVALGESCSTIEAAKTEIDALFKSAIANIGAGVTIGLSKNSPRNQSDAIETYKAAARTDLENFMAAFYNSFGNCLGTMNDGDQTTIAAATDGSTVGLRRVNNAIFNAVEAIRIAISTRSADTSLLSVLDENRNGALIGLRLDVEHHITWIKGVYVVKARPSLGLPMPFIFSTVYTQSVSASRYAGATETGFNRIAGILTSYAVGFSEIGTPEVSSNDIAQLETTLKYKTGIDLLLKQVFRFYPDTVVQDARFQEYFYNFIQELSRDYYLAISLAEDNDITGIEELRVEQSLRISEFTSITVELIQRNVIQADLESKITELGSDLTEAVDLHYNAVYDGALLLADVLSGNLIEDYSAKLVSIKNAASSAAADITYAIAMMRVETAVAEAAVE